MTTVISTIVYLVQSIAIGIKMALVEMSTHKLRSFLSTLGVLLGVASLVAMLTLIGGIDTFLNEKMGIWVGSVWFTKKWDPPEQEKLSLSRSPGLRLSDGEYLAERSPHVKNAPSSIIRNGIFSFGGSTYKGMLRGIDEAFLELDKQEVALGVGEWFSQENYRSGAPVCIVSWQVAQTMVKELRLKEVSEVIGKKVSFRNNTFTVIGTVVPIYQAHTPWQFRRSVMIPIRTMQKFISGHDPDPARLQIQLRDPANVKAHASLVARDLKERHRGVEDFEYRTAEWLDKTKEMLNNVSVLMATISIISLLVGGLSIMNVMLSSIAERIREIGTRKALGAQNLQVFIQFIAETTTLSFVGGAMGFIAGLTPLLFRDAILSVSQGAIEPTILPMHILYTCIIVTVVGMMFGLYPAIKASRMNPIDALRYE